MHERILDSKVVNADETPVKLLTKDGERTAAQCYMWQLSRWGPKPLVLFEFDRTRKKEVAERLLGDYSGYVQVDGYAGYNALFAESEARKRVGCMAHCLRKFKDLVTSLPKEKRPQHSANKVVKLIRKLTDIEEECKGLPFDERHKKRHESNAARIFEELQALVSEEMLAVSEKSPYYAALRYADDELPLIRRYLEDGQN